MTSNVHSDTRLLGTLQSADGKGVVRMQERFDTDIDDTWSAITDPQRLARWYGEVEGDLRVGGEYRGRLFATGWEGTGRIELCDPPHRLLISNRESDESGEGVIDVTLTADGNQTILVLEERGMSVEMIAGYGAGMQIHVEDLAAHLRGEGRVDAKARFGELYALYQPLAADVT